MEEQKVINLIVSNPVIKPLRTDRSFRLEVDLNFIDFDKFKDLPKAELLDLIIIPVENASRPGKNPYKYYYSLMAELAIRNKSTVNEEEAKLKKRIGIESKKQLTPDEFNRLLGYLEVLLGRKPPSNLTYTNESNPGKTKKTDKQ